MLMFIKHIWQGLSISTYISMLVLVLSGVLTQVQVPIMRSMTTTRRVVCIGVWMKWRSRVPANLTKANIILRQLQSL
ncbi:hypothetical protein F5Y18DRAFT_367856, partial [Xylariaceae sp. FL1019]